MISCRCRQEWLCLHLIYEVKLADKSFIVNNMEYISVVQFAEKYGISERTARNYCAEGKIDGAFLTGKTWNIPADAELPKRGRMRLSPLLSLLSLFSAIVFFRYSFYLLKFGCRSYYNMGSILYPNFSDSDTISLKSIGQLSPTCVVT